MEIEKELYTHKRIAGLDSLRGLAVVFIVLYHMFPDTVKGGFLGVSLFFVLSGYLLAVTGRAAWEKQCFQIGGFYKKRLFRIYPALLLMVLGTILLLNWFVPPAMSAIRSETASILGGYNNWWQITKNASYFTKVDGMSPFVHIWSLAIELQYYLIWPFLFLLCMWLEHRKGKAASCFLLLFLAVLSALDMILLYDPGQDPSRIYYGTDTRLSALLLGSALGMCRKPGQERQIKKHRCLSGCLAAAFAAMFILCMTADGQAAATYQWILPSVSLLFCGMIYLISLPELPVGRWMDTTPLAWLGKCSYEIYLCQYPLNFFFNIWKRGRNPYIMIIIELAAVTAVSLWLKYFSGIFRKERRKAQYDGREEAVV